MSDEEISDLSVDGVSLKNKDVSIVLKKHKGNVRNMIGNLYSLPIISELIADVLIKNCQNEIELFDVKIDMKNNFKFYFLNIIDCINLEKSVYTLFTPNALVFKTIDKLAFNTEKIDKDIFRIKGVRTKIIISEKIKQEIQALKFEEIRLTPIDEFVWKK
ncbi:imm11 family protein [Chryseobacterium indoltheticum]|uniref:imm11 family protein n=1 Tax=Chryseobacterium indoltheticum TaxID=254 RepID=UPI003F490E60